MSTFVNCACDFWQIANILMTLKKVFLSLSSEFQHVFDFIDNYVVSKCDLNCFIN